MPNLNASRSEPLIPIPGSPPDLAHWGQAVHLLHVVRIR